MARNDRPLPDADGWRDPPADPPAPCGCAPTGMLWIGDDRLRCPAARQLRADGLRALAAGDRAGFDQARRALAEHAQAVLRAAGRQAGAHD